MNELDMLEDLYELLAGGYIEVDDVADEPRFRPTPSAQLELRRASSAEMASPASPRRREEDVPLPFSGAVVTT